jgi:hypothetical protein
LLPLLLPWPKPLRLLLNSAPRPRSLVGVSIVEKELSRSLGRSQGRNQHRQELRGDEERRTGAPPKSPTVAILSVGTDRTVTAYETLPYRQHPPSSKGLMPGHFGRQHFANIAILSSILRHPVVCACHLYIKSP